MKIIKHIINLPVFGRIIIYFTSSFADKNSQRKLVLSFLLQYRLSASEREGCWLFFELHSTKKKHLYLI